MNFQELLAKMQQLDQPASTVEQVTDEMGCGGMPPSMPAANEPPVAPPSMSVNLNAQGMDNIEDLPKLVTKVNPDMDKPNLPSLPSMGGEPNIMSIKPSMPPLKMLPDLDSEDEEPGPDMMNKDGEEKDEKEAFANSPDDASEPESKGSPFDAEGNDLNKPKKSFSDKPYRGDNPMAAESTDLRAQIRAELQRRLNEAKGVK